MGNHLVRKDGKFLNPGRTTVNTRTVIFYSPDMDLCVCLSLFFQDRYRFITITDPDLMSLTVGSYDNVVLVVDASLSLRMMCRLDRLRREHPDLKIILFTASHPMDDATKYFLSHCVDVILFKPADLSEIITTLDSLTARSNDES